LPIVKNTILNPWICIAIDTIAYDRIVFGGITWQINVFVKAFKIINMKTLFVLLFSIAVFTLPNLESITKGLEQGNASTIAAFFEEQVEISILDVEGMYDKAVAKQKLASFFRKHEILSFEHVHKGTSKGKNVMYCIGNLVTVDQTFRVYVFLEIKGNKQLVQELRIDKE